MNNDELISLLRQGTVQKPSRWSGDCGEPNQCDENATDALMARAADKIEQLEKIVEKLQKGGVR